MACLVLAASSAQAGSYTVSRTGGTTPATVTPTPASTPAPLDASAGAAMSPGSGNGPGGNPNCSVTINPGTITDTFTWVPASGQTMTTDPPPTCVLVQQNSFARWYVVNEGGSETASGTAVPGLPGGTVTPGTYNAPLPSLTNSGLFYSQQSGASFSVSCKPTASFTGTIAAGALGSVQGEADVSSILSCAYPITISPGGTKPDSSGNPNILVGQLCTAAVNGIPSNLLPYATYNWSITGTTFESWGIVADAGSQSHTVEVDAIPATRSTQWYWNDLGPNPTPETIKCTVTITPPAGQGNSISLTVTAPKPVSVQVPSWTATGTGGDLQVNKTNPPSDGTDYWLYAGLINSPTDTGGMDWRVTVSSPNPALFADGTPQIAQLITNGESYTTRNARKVVTTYNWSTNGVKGLDSYPYIWVTQPPQYPSFYAGDEPGFDVGYLGAYSASLSDSFEDFLMYLAPGSSQPVPLAHFSWSTSGTDMVPGTGWNNFGPGSAGSVNPSGPASPFSAYNTFPKWTQVTDGGVVGSWVKAQ